MRNSLWAIAVAGFLPAALPLQAAHQLIRIDVEGSGLSEPVSITNRDALRDFSVWSGPGAYAEGVEETEGFIIDWRAGPSPAPPEGLVRYEARFFEGCYRMDYGCHGGDPALVYVVRYLVDPATGQGFVYLPAPGEKAFETNHTMWRGGREGRWFRASKDWDGYVQPMLRAAGAQ
ncbi:MAG: hypothetical protein GC160_03035 [Acidobacteria bacterium]|nr:hypothetical protein [Acidobacteriota bacterium]